MKGMECKGYGVSVKDMDCILQRVWSVESEGYRVWGVKCKGYGVWSVMCEGYGVWRVKDIKCEV